jgi:hypothetical protein
MNKDFMLVVVLMVVLISFSTALLFWKIDGTAVRPVTTPPAIVQMEASPSAEVTPAPTKTPAPRVFRTASPSATPVGVPVQE